MWHSERATAKRGVRSCKNPLLKTPFSWFLIFVLVFPGNCVRREVHKQPSPPSKTSPRHSIISYVLYLTSVVTGEHWTGSPNKSIDQIGKNCPKNVRKLCFQPLRTSFGHFFGHFSTFFGHVVDFPPLFWAVQRFAR